MLFSVLSWIKDSILDLLGLSYRSGRILFLGLDNAGMQIKMTWWHFFIAIFPEKRNHSSFKKQKHSLWQIVFLYRIQFADSIDWFLKCIYWWLIFPAQGKQPCSASWSLASSRPPPPPWGPPRRRSRSWRAAAAKSSILRPLTSEVTYRYCEINASFRIFLIVVSDLYFFSGPAGLARLLSRSRRHCLHRRCRLPKEVGPCREGVAWNLERRDTQGSQRESLTIKHHWNRSRIERAVK